MTKDILLEPCPSSSGIKLLLYLVHFNVFDVTQQESDFNMLLLTVFSKSEFVIYKLKEMGKIGEKDILQICNQFNKLDPNNTGKITLPDHCTAAADNLRNGQYPALDSNISVYRREGTVQSLFHVL